MPHTTEITDTFAESGHYVIEIQCCGGRKSRHSLGAAVVADPVKLDQSIQQAHNVAATAHEASLQAEAKIKALVGSKVDH